MAIYIEWDDVEQVFDGWEYVGSGITKPKFKQKKIIKQCLYSNDETQEMMNRAKKYIETDMQDRKNPRVNIK